MTDEFTNTIVVEEGDRIGPGTKVGPFSRDPCKRRKSNSYRPSA